MKMVAALLAWWALALAALAQGVSGSALVGDNSIVVTTLPYGATGNTKGYGDGTIANGSRSFSSNQATFAATDIGKTIVVDFAAGASVALVTTIQSVTDSHHVALAAAASNSVPYFLEQGASVVAAGTGCVPGDVLTVAGGTFTTQASVKVSHCHLVSVAVNAGGSGGHSNSGSVSGACTVTGTTGSGGVPFTVSVNLTSGVITSIIQIIFFGQYSSNPTNLTAEPVIGCAGITGATLSLTMGVHNLQPNVTGVYSVEPANPVSMGTSTGSETGVTWSAFWTTAGSFTYGTDDTAAIAKAINAEMSDVLAGNDRCVYFPAGVYMISSPLPVFYSNVFPGIPGCVEGQERRKTYIYVVPNWTGSVFGWSRSFNFGQDPLNGPTEVFSRNAEGARITNMIVVGDRLSSGIQDAFTFWDENQNFYMNNVEVDFLNGSAFRSGYTLNSTNAYVAESWIDHFRSFSSGGAGHPVMDFNTAGGGQGSNEIRVNTIDIYAPYSQAVWIHCNSTATVGPGDFTFNMLRVEGLQWDSGGVGLPFLEIGDPAAASCATTAVDILQSEMIDPYINAASILVTAHDQGHESYGVTWHGSLGGGAPLGRGIEVDYGRLMSFEIRPPGANNWDYNVQIGPSTQVSTETISVHSTSGIEQNLSWNIGSNSQFAPTGYPIRLGNYLPFQPGAPEAALVGNYHDGSANGGNAPGGGAVDWQTLRNSNAQVASAFSSTIVGGEANTASGTDCVVGGNSNSCSGGQSVVAGGFINSASGTSGWIPGGKAATDRGQIGVGCVASGALGAAFQGDSQQCWRVLRGTGNTASAIRVTSDGNTASSTNCVDIPTNAGFMLTIDVTAFDRTTPANNEAWSTWTGFLTRAAGNAALTMNATPTPITNGTVTGSGIAASADTVNECLNLSFTPPTGNTDTWDVVARVNTVEVQ